jgi:hypothetical protein
MAAVFATLAFASVILGTVLSLMIVREVSKRGVKINYFLLRILIFKYISLYKQLTTKETGRIGPLYYPCVVSFLLALFFSVVFIIVR